MAGLLNRRGPVSKLVGGTVGLVKEYSADRKERQASEQKQSDIGQDDSQQDQGSTSSHDQADGYSSEDTSDDETWAQELDEAQQDTDPTARLTKQAEQSEEEIVADFIKNHPPPPYHQQIPKGVLSRPVILPQRRPESRHRGFVRAYAPVLQDADIDEKTWLDFLDGFEKSINKNGWFHAANVAVWTADKIGMGVAGFSPTVFFVSMAVHLSVEGARRTYVHSKHNRYLDQMNESFFKPRGLFALVIKYAPKSDDIEQEVDMKRNIANTVSKRDGQSQWRNVMSASSGRTSHEEELPEFAPLVFPALDHMSEDKKQSSIKQFGGFLQEYYDRQAQARFDGANPDSKLAGVTPRKDFASSYSDPNSAVSKGGLISIASGGRYNPSGGILGGRRRRRRREGGRLNRRECGSAAGDSAENQQSRQDRRSNRGVRRLLKADTLYLMVVNMPSQVELDRAAAELKEAKRF